MPTQCSMASTVVAFRVAPLSPWSTGRTGIACILLSERRSPGQMCGVLGAIRN